ncbi:MAG: ABC transporter permease, partial [Candidatus Thorarchaeota archaeon]
MSLRSYVISRILLTIPMLMFLLTLVFLILRVMPGDPALLHFEKNVDPQVLAEFKARLGLDKPLPQQYVDYLFGVFRGDFGLSMQDFQPVTKQILDRFPATLELTVWAMLFAVIIGVFLGIVSAKNYDTFKDNSIRIFGIVTYAIPVFFLGMILQLIFGTYLHWLPTGSQIDPRLQPPRVTGMVTIDSLLAGNF